MPLVSDPDWNFYPNFSREEFVCPCGCSQVAMDKDFMDKLQHVRVLFGDPMIINSGYRCKPYNAQLGAGLPHPTGKAADIGINGLGALGLLREALYMSDFTGIGIRQHGPVAKRFIHLDTLTYNDTPAPRPSFWTYK